MSLRRSARLAALGTGAPLPLLPELELEPELQPQLRRSDRLIMPAHKWFSLKDIGKACDMATEVKKALDRVGAAEGKLARATLAIELYETLLGDNRLLVIAVPGFRNAVMKKTYEFEAEVKVTNNPNPLPEDTRRALASIIKRTRHFITDVAPLDKRYLTKDHLPLGWTARKDYTGRIVYRNSYRMTEVYERPTRTVLSF
jgi:hypothetical protein